MPYVILFNSEWPVRPCGHLKYKLASDRATKIEQASANRFHHTIKLASEKDIDKELMLWCPIFL